MPTQPIQRSEQPPVPHRWLLAALFAALVIAGLLGMHTLSTAHTEMQVAAASTETAAMDAEHVQVASGSMDPDTDSGCLECGTSDSHHAMIMACVLGLLVTVLLVCRAKPGLIRARGPSIVTPFVRSAVRLLPRQPSLTVLTISRT
jgi:hypothetical protein